jgi:hypothetical protein
MIVLCIGFFAAASHAVSVDWVVYNVNTPTGPNHVNNGLELGSATVYMFQYGTGNAGPANDAANLAFIQSVVTAILSPEGLPLPGGGMMSGFSLEDEGAGNMYSYDMIPSVDSPTSGHAWFYAVAFTGTEISDSEYFMVSSVQQSYSNAEGGQISINVFFTNEDVWHAVPEPTSAALLAFGAAALALRRRKIATQTVRSAKGIL